MCGIYLNRDNACEFLGKKDVSKFWNLLNRLVIKICKQFHFRNILVGVKDVSTPKKKKNAYIYLDFFFYI